MSRMKPALCSRVETEITQTYLLLHVHSALNYFPPTELQSFRIYSKRLRQEIEGVEQANVKQSDSPLVQG